MANIYLAQRQNRRIFARCFEELVKRSLRSNRSFTWARHMAIQEPEKAITAFEKARAMDPNNAELAVELVVPVTTHTTSVPFATTSDAVAADGASSICDRISARSTGDWAIRRRPLESSA